MKGKAGPFLVPFGSILLLGCTSYDDAVHCSAVYGIEAGRDPEFVHLKRYAERDAVKKGRMIGKSVDEVSRDISAAKQRDRNDVVRESPYLNELRRHCDAFYE